MFIQDRVRLFVELTSLPGDILLGRLEILGDSVAAHDKSGRKWALVGVHQQSLEGPETELGFVLPQTPGLETSSISRISI